MARTRAKLDGCGIAHASDLLGQRWALLVVRELLLGPKRFTDLRTDIPGTGLRQGAFIDPQGASFSLTQPPGY
jgi:DNA-binding HxlR family transcriptional regulator